MKKLMPEIAIIGSSVNFTVILLASVLFRHFRQHICSADDIVHNYHLRLFRGNLEFAPRDLMQGLQIKPIVTSGNDGYITSYVFSIVVAYNK